MDPDDLTLTVIGELQRHRPLLLFEELDHLLEIVLGLTGDSQGISLNGDLDFFKLIPNLFRHFLSQFRFNALAQLNFLADAVAAGIFVSSMTVLVSVRS